MTTAIAPSATTAYKQTSIYKHLDLLEHLIDDAAGSLEKLPMCCNTAMR